MTSIRHSLKYIKCLISYICICIKIEIRLSHANLPSSSRCKYYGVLCENIYENQWVSWTSKCWIYLRKYEKQLRLIIVFLQLGTTWLVERVPRDFHLAQSLTSGDLSTIGTITYIRAVDPVLEWSGFSAKRLTNNWVYLYFFTERTLQIYRERLPIREMYCVRMPGR